ncbi:oleosin 18.2 kDa [Tanacetum coccineum]
MKTAYNSDMANNGITYDKAALISDIDKAMKKHTDSLATILQGVNARLTQMESKSLQLENSVIDLKVTIGNNQLATFAKLWQIENKVKEVKDKHEILEARLRLSALKADQRPETQFLSHLESLRQVTPTANPFDDSYFQPPSGNPYELPQLQLQLQPHQQPQLTMSAPPLPHLLDEPEQQQQQQLSRPNSDPSSQNVASSSSAPQVPQACVAGSAVAGASGSTSSSVKKDPTEDVVDKVSVMGFPKAMVRETVKKLTETGQTVDLNVVLDKLMTDEVKN